MGDASMIDTMIKDGLWDAFNGYHMGNTAENIMRELNCALVALKPKGFVSPVNAY